MFGRKKIRPAKLLYDYADGNIDVLFKAAALSSAECGGSDNVDPIVYAKNIDKVMGREGLYEELLSRRKVKTAA